MKASKMIVALLSVSSINNASANKQELLQLEKEIKPISYEIVAESNWDNYYLVDTNATEMQNQIIQLNTQKNEVVKQRPPSSRGLGWVCSDILDAANECWNDPNLFRAVACYTAAMALYAACVAATSHALV